MNIVDRLKDAENVTHALGVRSILVNFDYIFRDAAAEIERLNLRIENCRASKRLHLARKDAEIEQLREDAEAGNAWERQLLGCDKELTQAYEEIKRLTKERDEARDERIKVVMEDIERADSAEIEQLREWFLFERYQKELCRSEIERFTTALREIQCACVALRPGVLDAVREIACAVLAEEDKP
jgi:chromosome segregation ATPase